LNCRSLHYGRDDKGEGGAPIERLVSGLKEKAGPSTALRSGRDDTSTGNLHNLRSRFVVSHISQKNERDMGHPVFVAREDSGSAAAGEDFH
jgi:hypothetical protein